MPSEHNCLKRRDFHQWMLGGASGLAIGAAAPGGWMQSLAATLSEEAPSNDRILVVIQMSGGNDGLNTIVPYQDERYYKARPKLAIPKDGVISIDSDAGLHPSLRGVASLIEDQTFSIAHGVGYPQPNRSHFESMDIWHSCQRKEARSPGGWLGRYFASKPAAATSDSHGLHLGSEALPMALMARGVQTPSLASVDQLRWKNKDSTEMESMSGDKASAMAAEDRSGSLLDFVSASTQVAMQASERIERALTSPDEAGEFPDTQLGEKLKIVSRLILAGLKTQVYYVVHDGFDTHSNQSPAHTGLLKQWSDALRSFHQRINRAGQSDRVLVMTFSEFGRRVAENASLGTDHGAAAPLYLSGPKFPKTFYGKQPDLGDLDDGDLKFSIDFRRVYATVIEDWLQAPTQNVLADEFKKLSGLL